MHGSDDETARELAGIAAGAGLSSITMLAWRDLADTEAGGSEVHADRVATEWARAGLDVTLRTSAARGFPRDETRHGYRVIRRSGRNRVFPTAIRDQLRGRLGPTDANERLITMALTALISALVVLPAVIGEHSDGPMARALRRRTISWIGMVSYGIYLWHLLVMRWLEETWQLKDFWPLLGATVVLTIPIAAASWYLVEAPLLRRKDPRPRSRARDESPVPAGKIGAPRRRDAP